MKSIISKTMLLVVLAVSFMSFAKKTGGEGYEIFVGSKLVIQQFGATSGSVQSLQLNPANTGDKISVKYYHCGQPGKDRVITIKDETGAQVKEIRYNDSPTANSVMTIEVRELLTVKKGKTGKLSLYYVAKGMPSSRLLTTISL